MYLAILLLYAWYPHNAITHVHIQKRNLYKLPCEQFGQTNWLLVAKGGVLEVGVLAMEVQLNSVVMVNHVNGGVKSQLDSCEDKVGMVVRYDGYLPRQLHKAHLQGEQKLGKCKRHGVSKLSAVRKT